MNTHSEIINELQDFMFNEENIKSYLSIRNEYNSEKQNKVTENNNKKQNIKPLEKKQTMYFPGQQDSLFWCYYIIKHGDIKYESLHYRNILVTKQLKIDLYRDLIRDGLLDQKLARRIRSDSSGYLSADILHWLFLNRPKYSDDDFQNLVLNFCDTKHKWVARFIALNMPKDLIPYLMGLEDPEAIKILEKRMS
jgi:hypothetical protein